MTSHAHHDRLHSLDALRAIAMLLGIVLHAEMAYMAHGWDIWPAKDDANNRIFDLSFHAIHFFRMETFFLMAGFFACLLYVRDGARGVLFHRLKRIALPLLIGFVTIVPLCKFVFGLGYNINAPANEQISTATLALGVLVNPWRPGAILYHLWFLYDLLFLYIGAIAIAQLANRFALIARAGNAIENAVAWIVTNRLLAPALACAMFIALQFQTGGISGSFGVDTAAEVYPVPFRVILYYAIFFGAGWIIYRRREVLNRLGSLWPLQLLAALICFLIWLQLAPRALQNPDDANLFLIGRAITALTTAFLVVGITGMFLRIFDRPSPAMRYISDSAYWLYLLHLPLVLLLNYAVAPLTLGAIPKFLIVTGVSSIILLASYQLFVRYTPIGVMLNGPRTRPLRARPPEDPDPRATPALATAE